MGFNIKYDVENIGNIGKASISIKPLTIIAGENSSGKTFITKSLYTILNAVYRDHFSSELIKSYDNFKKEYIYFLESLHTPAKIDIEFENSFKIFHKNVTKFFVEMQLCNFEDQETKVKDYYDLFKNFEKDLKQYFNNRLSLKKFKKFEEDISLILATYDAFRSVILNRINIVVSNIATHLNTGFKKNFQITDLKNLIKQDKKKLKLSLSTIGDVELNFDEELNFNFHGKGIQKVQNVENIVFFDSPVYMKLRKALQKRDSGFGSYFDKKDYLRGYPEYLDKLYEYIENEYIGTPIFEEISSDIHKLISGGLNISKSGEIIYKDNEGNSIPLALTAMGISNIGLIDLLIRNNTINKGSFLIMDEPEVHLHPKWQVALANLLFKIADNGANIIIATHSLDLLKAFETILKEKQEAEKIIAINKMPYEKSFTQKSELEKVQMVLDDLSRPYYDLYLQDI